MDDLLRRVPARDCKRSVRLGSDDRNAEAKGTHARRRSRARTHPGKFNGRNHDARQRLGLAQWLTRDHADNARIRRASWHLTSNGALPHAAVNEALAHLEAGKARYRIVLDA